MQAVPTEGARHPPQPAEPALQPAASAGAAVVPLPTAKGGTPPGGRPPAVASTDAGGHHPLPLSHSGAGKDPAAAQEGGSAKQNRPQAARGSGGAAAEAGREGGDLGPLDALASQVVSAVEHGINVDEAQVWDRCCPCDVGTSPDACRLEPWLNLLDLHQLLVTTATHFQSRLNIAEHSTGPLLRVMIPTDAFTERSLALHGVQVIDATWLKSTRS